MFIFLKKFKHFSLKSTGAGTFLTDVLIAGCPDVPHSNSR
jgi:hypothetical protein